jgi:hypothetical protein
MVFSEVPNIDAVSTNSRKSFDRDDDKDNSSRGAYTMDHLNTLRM